MDVFFVSVVAMALAGAFIVALVLASTPPDETLDM
jgi:hypothetical protein